MKLLTLRKSVFAISLALYFISLCLPVLMFQGGDLFFGTPATYGFTVLLSGWIALIFSFSETTSPLITWGTNIFYFLALFFFITGDFKWSLIFTAIMSLVLLTIIGLFHKGVYTIVFFDSTMPLLVTKLLPGFYVWLVAIYLPGLCSAYLFFRKDALVSK